MSESTNSIIASHASLTLVGCAFRLTYHLQQPRNRRARHRDRGWSTLAGVAAAPADAAGHHEPQAVLSHVRRRHHIRYMASASTAICTSVRVPLNIALSTMLNFGGDSGMAGHPWQCRRRGT